ncbi:hypothetical protein GRQ65_16030 [Nocardioides sp. YIM 123512]|uniref:Phosphotransferase enzyme family protein n=1 Tax=Nocardioides flavescens TaxID=2691959 RepID=A0A6L7EU68_9ACTN|nr:hypothetical protein [Nocardioides flavescens]MXG91057.1 hypothetical protein [Nocardioides flavescens]
MSSLPTGRTARRLEWVHLPPHVRALVEARLGSPVVGARTRTAGYTPEFSSVLTTAAGTRHDVHAASVTAQRAFAGALGGRAATLATLPAGVPAPRLRWVDGADATGRPTAEWVVLETEHHEGRMPLRPWDLREVGSALDSLERAAALLTPAPSAPAAPGIGDEIAGWPELWDDVRVLLPGMAEHLDEAVDLAASCAEATTGDTLVHFDLRDDQILVRPDGTVLLAGWDCPVRGAAWIDTVLALLGPRGDGHDADALLATRPLTREVPVAHVDALLALVAGWSLRQSGLPAPTASPYLRDLQRWQGEVAWTWLAQRRGWI